MNSRIILTQADFSQNNIGRYVELSELTKKVLAKQTQYGEGSDEAAALNIFLANLIGDGFIGGENPLLKTLIIPALADSHDELFYNIALLDSNGYPTNEMYSDEIGSQTPNFAVVENDGVKIGCNRVYKSSITSEEKSANCSIDSHLFPTYNVEYPDFSVIYYGGKAVNTSYSDTSLFSSRALNYIPQLGSTIVRLYYESNAYVRNEITDGKSARGFWGLNYKAKTTWSGIAGDGTIGAVQTAGDLTVLKTQKSSSNPLSDSNRFMVGESYVDADRRATFSAIAFGDYIDNTTVVKDGKTKMQLLKSYFDTLMTNLHVKTW